MNEQFRETLLLLITTPIYMVVIGSEILLSYFQHKKIYTIQGAITNMYLMLLNMGLDILMRGACLAILTYFYQFHLTGISNSYIYWIVLLIAEDFAYYLLHYLDHHSRFFWAVHVTHHSSDEYNLTVGFRSSVLQPLYRFVFFIPLALIGFQPLDILFMYAATQIYGILVHTQYVGKLGWLEYIFCTPSNHRVHHASNVQYLDKNMGMVFIIWDRIFGTYKDEEVDKPITFGLTKKIENQNAVTIIFHEWIQMAQDVLHKGSTLKDKIGYLFAPPGWSHDGSSKTSKQLQQEYYYNIQEERKN